MAQWTIDPRDITRGDVSPDVTEKVLRVFEARVIVRTGRHTFRTPSWTTTPTGPARECSKCGHVHTDAWTPDGPPREGRLTWYHQTIVGRKADCDCPATGWCHHGYAAYLVAEGREPAPTTRTRLTVIPGGAR